jgi:CheY-like chemotaxis protein
MSMKVLIADPDWRFAHQASRYLESHAHLVLCESDPRGAWERARTWQPDLVILAAELAEKGLMNRVNSLPHRPAVLLTEHMDRYDRAWRAWQTGGDELLMKPVFKTEEFHQAMVTALENAATGNVVRPVAVSA